LPETYTIEQIRGQEQETHGPLLNNWNARVSLRSSIDSKPKSSETASRHDRVS
jgi:hypothetical protein